jgi:hypothetical protein
MEDEEVGTVFQTGVVLDLIRNMSDTVHSLFVRKQVHNFDVG